MNLKTHTRIFLAAITVCVGLSAQPAQAQLGLQAGFVEAFQPDYMNRDITLFVDFLILEDWQVPTVETLMQDYSDDFKVGCDGLRDEMKGMKDQIINAGDQGAMGVIMLPINKWIQEKARLKQRFVENLRSVLSDEQQERWPKLERAMRREKELPRGLLSGESVDLRQVSRECEVPPDFMLAAKEALDEYELGLDAALVARSTQLLASQDKIKEALVAQDYARGLKELELIVATRVALRDLQDSSREKIATAYGDPWGPIFQAKALAAAFPAAYRPSPMIPYFAAALELSGLSPEQIAQLNALQVEYVKFYEDWRMRLVTLYRTEEPKKQTEETRRKLTQGNANVQKGPLDPYRPMLDERDAMDEKTRQKIAEIVGPELSEQLPGAAKLAAAAQRPMGNGKGKGEEIGPALNAQSGGDAPRRSPSENSALSRPTSGGRDKSNTAPPKTAD